MAEPASGLELILGTATLVTGVEQDPEDKELLRVYVGARYKNQYVLIKDKTDQENIQRAWANPMHHLLIPTPKVGEVYQG